MVIFADKPLSREARGVYRQTFFLSLPGNIDRYPLALNQSNGKFLEIYQFLHSRFLQLGEAVMNEVGDPMIDVLVGFDKDPMGLEPDFDGFIDDLHRHPNAD